MELYYSVKKNTRKLDFMLQKRVFYDFFTKRWKFLLSCCNTSTKKTDQKNTNFHQILSWAFSFCLGTCIFYENMV